MPENQTPELEIPANLLPSDGRFGSGPSMVPHISMQNLANEAEKYMGNSHRKDSVRGLVGNLQEGCRNLFNLPADWEVLLGNGGATLFWDALSFTGIKKQSQHLCFGEFSSRFANVVENTPHLNNPERITSDMGTHPEPTANPEVDFYALTQNETSTGVAAPLIRPATDGLVGVDATSAAGGMLWDTTQADIYFFSLQKGFASDGGIWLACCSPAALERFEEVRKGRWSPDTLDLHLAHRNSIKQQTLNTPAIATLYLAVQYSNWVLDNGGLEWAANRSKTTTDYVYDWAEKYELANPFVSIPSERSPVIATISIDESIASATICRIFRKNNILDVDPYRKLNQNLLRFGLFPARDPKDAKALCECLEFVIENI